MKFGKAGVTVKRRRNVSNPVLEPTAELLDRIVKPEEEIFSEKPYENMSIGQETSQSFLTIVNSSNLDKGGQTPK